MDKTSPIGRWTSYMMEVHIFYEPVEHIFYKDNIYFSMYNKHMTLHLDYHKEKRNWI